MTNAAIKAPSGAGQILDHTGKPLRYGNTDPNIVSVDDNPKFEMRKLSDFPDVPQEVKTAEVQYILPMANMLAQALGINIIEEKTYEKVIDSWKQRSLFVVLNLEGVKVSQGVADWFGLIIMCKQHAVAMVKLKLQLSTSRIGITQFRIWRKATQNYLVVGDKEQRKFLNREEVTTQILNYLRIEGIYKT